MTIINYSVSAYDPIKAKYCIELEDGNIGSAYLSKTSTKAIPKKLESELELKLKNSLSVSNLNVFSFNFFPFGFNYVYT